ncbi:MAG: hypothetical protein EGP63_10795 [Bacteroides stercoris]|nr:hypothetical protein [Bacteroides stercoris]MBD9148617.1 hypothetical protein [Bacteroides stercoris]
MTWQQCHILRSALICYSSNLFGYNTLTWILIALIDTIDIFQRIRLCLWSNVFYTFLDMHIFKRDLGNRIIAITQVLFISPQQVIVYPISIK